ncbi:hypothetical protein PCASD_00792 [Puccinia coronata f. sp. avenae]|uniref:Uncharacterized protein n=1 Tax=Puccinia coronata f. sp. avenae TaxID=200324 RepID=A0A2N5VPJ9_9BASI|nr:hypothetical protein PCASD_00792 [Puccinia coronata f. sp. avenae]
MAQVCINGRTLLCISNGEYTQALLRNGNANMLNPTPATNAKVCLASIARFSQRTDGVGMCCSTAILPRLRNGAISNTPGQVFPAAASTISVSCSEI